MLFEKGLPFSDFSFRQKASPFALNLLWTFALVPPRDSPPGRPGGILNSPLFWWFYRSLPVWGVLGSEGGMIPPSNCWGGLQKVQNIRNYFGSLHHPLLPSIFRASKR